ncbi:MAG: hypothetical protein PVF43_06405 [Candidatus Eiseniibacteriota bacterium]
MAGALLEAELVAIAQRTGFDDAHVVERFDCFRGTEVKRRIAASRGVQGVNVYGRAV